MSVSDGGSIFYRPGEGRGLYAVAEHTGLTLRDFFAAAALQGMLADSEMNMVAQEYAEKAFALADAMLAERAK